MKNEIIIYHADYLTTRLEVRIEEETVWLNRQQLSMLFDRDIKTIGRHIANVLKEELKGISVVAKFATMLLMVKFTRNYQENVGENIRTII